MNTPDSRKLFAVKVPLNLDTIMSHVRQKNQDQKAKTHVHVRRTDLLHGTLKAMRAPEFNFRKTPVLVLTGDDTEDDREEPINEFFRSRSQIMGRSRFCVRGEKGKKPTTVFFLFFTP